MEKGDIGAESAMRIIFEYVNGEPYEHEDLSARADPERYVWEHEHGDWSRSAEAKA